ncbi:MAG TPA: cobalamin-binding protein, partial [Solirubrobacteraceae bacterium]|nr:cobalamin-binding protein [Solirubrobacteraceae bacterium]
VELVHRAAVRVDRVKLSVRAQPRPRVAALEWLDPVFVGGHWVPQLIELAGGEDVLGLVGEPSATSTWQAVAASEPQVVVVMPCGYDAPRAHVEALAHARELAALGAARVVTVNASAYFSRPGPRLIDGLELLAHILHPGVLAAPDGVDAPLEVELAAAAVR